MKKTVTANISGTVFHIEEDAFLKLGRYLESIRGKFTGTDGREEIMADIEARIAELFQQRLEGRNVVSIGDVEHVIGVMGQPEDYASEEAGAGAGAGATGGDPTRSSRRLFRDPDDNWVGGVLSGLGAYIKMDALWVRIIFLVLLIPMSFGTLAFVYILMWILVPRADSAADRLQMRGEAVNVDNIKRVFEEGGDRFKKGAEQMAKEAHDLGKDWEPKAKAWGQEAAQAARRTGRNVGSVLGKVFGIFFILVGIGMLMGLISGAVGLSAASWTGSWGNGNTDSLDLGGLLFASSTHAVWMAVAGFLLLAIPVIGLLIAGFHLLMNTHAPRWFGWSLCLIWLAALITAITLGVGLGSDFRQRARNRTEAAVAQPTGKVMHVAMHQQPETSWSYGWTFDHDGFDWRDEGLQIKDGQVNGWWAECDVERSPDTLYHLVVQREARGMGNTVAATRAEHITYTYEQQGDTLLLSPILNFPQTDKFRGQWVRFILQVPSGCAVHLNEGTQHIIDNIDNVTDTWENEMVGRTWTMTSRGLEDLDHTPGESKDSEIQRRQEEQRLYEEHQRPDSLRTKRVAAIVFRGPAPKKVKVATVAVRHPERAVGLDKSQDSGRSISGVGSIVDVDGSFLANPRRAYSSAGSRAQASNLSFSMPNLLYFVPFLR